MSHVEHEYRPQPICAGALPVIPLTLALFVVAVVGACAACWALLQLRREADERRRVLAALASSRALLGQQPAAVYRRDRRSGAESFVPGASTGLGLGGVSAFADFLACFDRTDAAAIADARERLDADGTTFRLEARA